MTTAELQERKIDAAYCLFEIRKHGGLVLRLPRGAQWRLYIFNGVHVPSELKYRLLELQPFVMVLLKELAR